MVGKSNKLTILTKENADEMEFSFEELSSGVQRRLERAGITDLFPVQKASFKLFMEGKELIVKSKTGSGKTLAFLLPLIEMINVKP